MNKNDLSQRRWVDDTHLLTEEEANVPGLYSLWGRFDFQLGSYLNNLYFR